MTDRLNVVTGATGLLGSHIVEKLAARGERVRALVRASSDTRFLQALGVEVVSGDLGEPTSLAAAMRGAAVVYHCGARVGDWGAWSDFRSQVIDATRNVAAACRAGGVGRLLHVSSISVYGHPRQRDTITEDEPLGQHLRFLDHYGRATIAAEEQLQALGAAVTIVRPSWIFGPRDRNGVPRLVSALRGRWVRIQGQGDNLVNIVHAGDVAEGAIAAANWPGAAGRAYHLCSEGELTQRQYLDAWTDALGLSRIERHISSRQAYLGGLCGDIVARALRWRRPPHISRYSVALLARPTTYSIARAKEELGWQPRTPLRDAIRGAVDWYRAVQAAAP
jgi:nucleoside-diphosphate-sugar epimerase